MHAEILAFGTEILMGEIVDTNSSYIASRLPPLGIELRYISVAGDEMEELTGALRLALSRSDIIFVTGGLGPTKDDLTRHAIAEALGEKLEVDPDLLADLRRWFERQGRTMPEGNIQQATRIPSVQIIANPRGTAPGWWAEKNGRIIVAMPGVPSELEYMWDQHVTPRLKQRPTGNVIITRTLKTFGLSEAAIGDQISHLFNKKNPYLGIYPRLDGIHLRIIAQGPTEEAARRVAEPVEREIRQGLDPVIWGVDRETTEERVMARLREDGLTLAVMEVCTGGLLASALTDVPGSADCFRGGIVAYADDVQALRGVDPKLLRQHGAVSAPVAEAMAQAARRELGADIGVGVTAVVDPLLSPSKGRGTGPVLSRAEGPADLQRAEPGTVYLAVASDRGVQSSTASSLHNRPFVKRRIVTQVLLQLLNTLRERAPR